MYFETLKLKLVFEQGHNLQISTFKIPRIFKLLESSREESSSHCFASGKTTDAAIAIKHITPPSIKNGNENPPIS